MTQATALRPGPAPRRSGPCAAALHKLPSTAAARAAGGDAGQERADGGESSWDFRMVYSG